MKRPIVCIFGISDEEKPEFDSGDVMTMLSYQNDNDAKNIVSIMQPDVVITIGESWNKFPNLAKNGVHNRWVHCKSINDLKHEAIYFCYISNLSKNILRMPKEKMPLVSCFSPSYNSTGKIHRPFRSLRAQTYPYWEWIIINDQPHCPKNCQTLKELEESDARIRVYNINKNTANIGQHKFETASLSRGKYLIELDHDDDLTPDCLEMVKNAFDQYPEAGFVYTDFCELFEKDLKPYKYGPVWAFGFGGYYAQMTKIPGVEEPVLTWVARSANMNEVTISNIVGVPNHIRVWKKDLYMELGGHNPLAVGDDYELLVRTFLKTKMVRIPYLGYYQYRNEDGNTTFKRMNLITMIQATTYKVYYDKIQARIKELGLNQKNYKHGKPIWEQENDYEEATLTLTYKKEDVTTYVILTYQGKDYFEGTLKNILETGNKNSEICIVGDGVDYLDEVIEKYNTDLRLRWWNLHKSFDDGGQKAKKYADYHMVRTGNPVYIHA